MKHTSDESCPCCSGKPYFLCCKILHDGGYAENALALMRSRYSAYAKKLPDYIIRTTHPSNSSYNSNHAEWTNGILDFYGNTEFHKLEILNFVDGPEVAMVSFIAYLKQGSLDFEHIEKSEFKKIGKEWLYSSALFLKKV